MKCRENRKGRSREPRIALFCSNVEICDEKHFTNGKKCINMYVV